MRDPEGRAHPHRRRPPARRRGRATRTRGARPWAPSPPARPWWAHIRAARPAPGRHRGSGPRQIGLPCIELVEERLGLTCPPARLAVERFAAHQERRERGGERAAPILEREAATEEFEPMHAESDVRDLLAPDQLLHARALFVARRAEHGGIARGVLQIRALDTEPHHCDERRRIDGRGDAFPEPIAHGEIAITVTEPRELALV